MTMVFFTLITQKNRESILPFIAQEFVTQYNLVNGIQKAQVTTAMPMTQSLRERDHGPGEQADQPVRPCSWKR